MKILGTTGESWKKVFIVEISEDGLKTALIDGLCRYPRSGLGENEMAQYRKKPVVIEAFCLDGGAMPDWFLDARSAGSVRTYAEGTGNPFNDPLTHAEIDTLEGTHRANRGTGSSKA